MFWLLCLTWEVMRRFTGRNLMGLMRLLNKGAPAFGGLLRPDRFASCRLHLLQHFHLQQFEAVFENLGCGFDDGDSLFEFDFIVSFCDWDLVVE